jgi:hypothetical protein
MVTVNQCKKQTYDLEDQLLEIESEIIELEQKILEESSKRLSSHLHNTPSSSSAPASEERYSYTSSPNFEVKNWLMFFLRQSVASHEHTSCRVFLLASCPWWRCSSTSDKATF